jgi:hypothetical protein
MRGVDSGPQAFVISCLPSTFSTGEDAGRRMRRKRRKMIVK